MHDKHKSMQCIYCLFDWQAYDVSSSNGIVHSSTVIIHRQKISLKSSYFPKKEMVLHIHHFLQILGKGQEKAMLCSHTLHEFDES